MKVLLIIPPTRLLYHTKGPDLGIGYLATSLRRGGHQVNVLDCLRDEIRGKRLKKYIINARPDVIGIKVLSKDLKEASDIVSISRNVLPETTIILGGPHPSGDPGGTLNIFPHVDFVFRGEAEIGLPMLLERIEGRGIKKKNHGLTGLKEIPGLAWRVDGQIHLNTRIYVEDLDSLGLPAWDLIDPRDYPGDYMGNPCIPLITTRGCPYNCTYCGGHTVTGKKIRHHSIDYLMEFIDVLVGKYGVGYLSIWDDNFTLDRDFARGFCEAILKREFDLEWGCPNGLRLDTLDEELLRLMEGAGCRILRVAIESGSQRILDHMQRMIDLGTVKEKVSLIRKVTHMELHGFFIIGYPLETEDDIKETVNLALSLDLDQAAFFLFTPFPGTHFYPSRNFGSGISWPTFHYDSVSIPLKGISKKRLKGLQRSAYLRFYLRVKVLRRVFNRKKFIPLLLPMARRFFGMLVSSQ